MKQKDIYEKLREARRSRGLTVNELADEIGENHQKVGRIERGKRSLTVDYLLKLSKALDTPLDSLLNEETQDTGEDSSASDSSNLLNDIVILVEEKNALLPNPFTAKDKGRLISKTYELALKFPKPHQSLFVESFLEGLFSIHSSL
ncbi:MAG: hypothetical protein K1000chlam2_01642 [Chlamydiae bacterium]|nr:hypothetical protein [Chlamydiota bacterium]